MTLASIYIPISGTKTIDKYNQVQIKDRARTDFANITIKNVIDVGKLWQKKFYRVHAKVCI